MSITTEISGAVQAQPATVTGDVDQVVLPCPGFPVVESETTPIDMTRGEGGTAVIAAKPDGRRVSQIIEIDLSILNDEEVAALVTAWNDGLGLVTPFPFSVPGYAGARVEDVVFKDPLLDIEYGTPVVADTRVRLRVVTPPDAAAGAATASGAFDRSWSSAFDYLGP